MSAVIRKMRFSEIGEVNKMINITLKDMKEVTSAEFLRIKMENNIPMIFIRKLIFENILIYEKNKKITGTSAYMRNLIGNVFVEPSQQHKGIGTALVSECEKRIKKKFNNCRVFAYKKAVSFHKKRGYIIKNKSCLLMEKEF